MINDDETRMFTTRDSSNLDGWIRKYVSSLAKVNTTFWNDIKNMYMYNVYNLKSFSLELHFPCEMKKDEKRMD